MMHASDVTYISFDFLFMSVSRTKERENEEKREREREEKETNRKRKKERDGERGEKPRLPSWKRRHRTSTFECGQSMLVNSEKKMQKKRAVRQTTEEPQKSKTP